MFGAEANCTPTRGQVQYSPIASRNSISTKPRICFLKKKPSPRVKLGKTQFSFALSHSSLHFTLQRSNTRHAHFSLNASSASGFREKVFENIGVKVYAAGFYVSPSVFSTMQLWKGRSAAEILEDSSIFSSIFEAPLEKSLQIVLVRDLDGTSFCYTLYDAISPRIKFTTSFDRAALSIFRSTFGERPLRKGTFIFLTWLHPFKMNVCIASDGQIPSSVDATIESGNVASSLFYVFLGDAPLSLLKSFGHR